MRRGMVFIVILLIFSCGKDKGSDKKLDYRVCKYLDWYKIENTGDITGGVSCWQGHTMLPNREFWYPATTKCKGSSVFDPDNYYFEKYQTKECPKEGIIAECKSWNSNLYIYKHSDVEFNNEIFDKYCRERLQGIVIL